MKSVIRYSWLYVTALLICISACHRKSSSGASGGIMFTEDFEQGSKAQYNDGDVTLKSGKWYLSDALIGASNEDAKNGRKAVRLRNNGKLSMQFNADGATQLTLNYATYGKDGASDWQLWVSTDDGKSYVRVGGTITAQNHALQQALFRLPQQDQLRIEIRKISGGRNRIDIDDIVLSSGNTAPTGGGQPVAGDNGNLLLGNPSGATANVSNAGNYLIDHKYYIESYNRDKGEPNWVSWHISASDLGSVDRLNNFRADSSLPRFWFESDPQFYIGTGFDKGHNCPSGDRTSSEEANSATFLMDNMIPQAPNNNQHTWEHFEAYCRNQIKVKGYEVFVIMGSYGSGGTGRNGFAAWIGHGKINVPSHIWKVAVFIPNGNNDLLRINSTAEVVAINTPNDNSLSPDWMNYTCTVSDIEKATGYHLFSALPPSIRSALEAKKYDGAL